MVATAGPASTFTGLPTEVEYCVGALSIAYGPLAFAVAARKHVRSIGAWLAVINVGSTVALVAMVLTGLAALIGDLQYLGVRRMRA